MQHHWMIFEQNGLPRGRSLGDKGTYHRDHPQSFFLPGARVCSAVGVIWTGDLDLTTADAARLVQVAAALGMQLYVHTESTLPRTVQDHTKMPIAIVSASGIEITQWGRSYLSPGMHEEQVRVTRDTAPARLFRKSSETG